MAALAAAVLAVLRPALAAVAAAVAAGGAPVRVAVVGSRRFASFPLVAAFVGALPRKQVVVVSGGAPGVDRVAESRARGLGMQVNVLAADWVGGGRGAGIARNKEIVAAADIVVAFWDGESKGTASTIGFARAAGVPVFVIYAPGAAPAAQVEQQQLSLF